MNVLSAEPGPASRSCAVAVMAKASAPGRTKTRLSPPLTGEEAASFNTAFLKDIIANIDTAAREASIAGCVAYGPAGSGDFFAATLPGHIRRFEATLPDFGACLSFTIDHLFALGHASAAVLNSDSPTLPPAFLVGMAAILDRPGDRAVLGPSTDGGYYVLGLKRMHPRLFQEIDWSTERVAEQTLARAREIDLPVEILPTWYDVDDAASLRILHGELFGDQAFGSGSVRRGAAEHTRILMQALLADGRLQGRLGQHTLREEAHALPA